MEGEVAYGENQKILLQYCVNCGERLDPVILRNREFPEPPEVVKVKHRYGGLNEGNDTLQVRGDQNLRERLRAEERVDAVEEKVQRETSEGDLP